MTSYKEPDDFWAEWHATWEEENKKVYSMIKALKKDIAALPVAPEKKKHLEGLCNGIGKWIMGYEKMAGEHHFRELEYMSHIHHMNAERQIFKDIVVDLVKKLNA